MKKIFSLSLVLTAMWFFGCGPSKEQLQTLEDIKKLASETSALHDSFMKEHQKEDEEHRKMEQKYDSLKAAGKSTPALDSMAAAHKAILAQHDLRYKRTWKKSSPSMMWSRNIARKLASLPR